MCLLLSIWGNGKPARTSEFAAHNLHVSVASVKKMRVDEVTANALKAI